MPLRFFLKIKNLIETLVPLVRIYFSGLFEKSTYQKYNPECQFGKIRCIIHWIRHGVHENRKPSDDIFAIWALPLLAQGELNLLTQRQLKKAFLNNRLEEISEKIGFSYSELIYVQAYQKGDFKQSLNALQNTNGVFYLRRVHKALRFMPPIPEIRKCYDKIIADPDLQFSKLNPRDQHFYYNISFAAGTTWPQLSDLKCRILRNSKISSEIAPGNVLSSFKNHQLLNKLARENSCRSKSFLGIKIKLGQVKIVETENDAVIIFVPNNALWKSNGKTQKFICDAFQNILQYILQNRHTVVCLPLPHTRDLSHTKLPFERAISYHTYATNRPQIVHYKESSLSGFLMVDETGYSGASTIGKSTNYLNTPSCKLNEARQRYRSTSITKYEQEGDSNEIPQNGFVFIPMQIGDDSVRRWQHLSSAENVKILAKSLNKSTIPLVIKPHPKDKSMETARILKELTDQNLIQVVQAPIQDLIEKSTFVVVANSGVGFEALLMNKPVISTGGSEYEAGTIQCATAEELIEKTKLLWSDVNLFNHKKANQYLQTIFERSLVEFKKDKSLNQLFYPTALARFETPSPTTNMKNIVSFTSKEQSIWNKFRKLFNWPKRNQ